MKLYKGIITFFLFLLFPSFCFASASFDVMLEGNETVSLDSEFSLELAIRNVVGSNLMNIGGNISVEDTNCLSFVRMEPTVEYEASVITNGAMFVYQDFDGFQKDSILFKAYFRASNQTCSTKVLVSGMNYMFTDPSIPTGSTNISKTMSVANHLEGVTLTSSLNIQNDEIVVSKNDYSSLDFQYQITPESVTDTVDVIWHSSNPNVAHVDAGRVEILNAGKTDISVMVISKETGKSFQDSVSLHVLVPATGITILDDPFLMPLNTEKKLNLAVTPMDTTDAVSFSSSEPSVLRVTSDGILEALSPGKSLVTVTVGNYSATVLVRVYDPDHDFLLNVSKHTLNASRHETFQLELETNDEPGRVIWSSSDPEYVAVSETGLVTALKAYPGSKKDVVITATWISSDDETYRKEATSIIQVVAPIESLTMLEETVYFTQIGETKQLGYVLMPEITSDSSFISWVSSDESIVQVKDGLLRANSFGVARITATTSNGISKSVSVVVIGSDIDFVLRGKNEMHVGDKMNLEVLSSSVVWDANLFEYFSSDESIAKVSETGEITALKEGNVVITVRVNGKEMTHHLVISQVVHPKTGLSSVTTSMIIVVVSLIGIGYSLFKKYQLI